MIPPLHPSLNDLPACLAIPDLREALRTHRAAVFQAPPGAGKSTVVPLALLHDSWLENRKIIMLEPRRLAARLCAARMAFLLGERVGETIGLRIRQETRVSAKTRLEVVTEGVLTRMLQSDPELSDAALIIFDEFHERSLHADLGLALTLDVRDALRNDLGILVMSATLDSTAIARLLGNPPIIVAEGRLHPVRTKYSAIKPGGRAGQDLVTVVQMALREDSGSLLVFLAGEGEIKRAYNALHHSTLPPDVDLVPLYGALSPAEQDAAIRPASPGRRKIVLATSIAETSLTIEGVRTVIDSGQTRRPLFDPRSGLSRLATCRVSLAEADQRRGRAGRTGPGLCYRLWPEAETRALSPFAPPEITEADLCPLALELAAWGSQPEALRWLNAPPSAAWEQARTLLKGLGAIDQEGKITPHGRHMADFPLHPRLSHMILAAQNLGWGGPACNIAALLSERDPLRKSGNTDIRLRLEAIQGTFRPQNDDSLDRPALTRIRHSAAEWRKRIRASETKGPCSIGTILALAYPDRIGKRRGPDSYLLSNGRGACLPEGDKLAESDFLVIADLDLGMGSGGTHNARIFLASSLLLQELEDLYPDRIIEEEVIGWNPRTQSVQARRHHRFGALSLRDTPLSPVSPSRLIDGMIEGIRQNGLSSLPWTPACAQLRDRVLFLRQTEGNPWPDMSDTALTETLPLWLGPYLTGLSKIQQLKDVPLRDALQSMLDYPLLQRLETEAPTHYEMPSGARIALDYAQGPFPVLATRLQDFLGMKEHPCLARNRIPLLLHILSPARRPIQITQDLPGFWQGSYAAIKAEMKGRYPKHAWPDNPLAPLPARPPRKKTD